MINLIGQKFGRLIVVKKKDSDEWRHHRWLCKCSCGKEKIIRGYFLTSGHTQSCGCFHKAIITKHGRSQDNRTYKSWCDIVQRCTNPNNSRYKDYGGRGITVCERWMKFKNFLEDMGESPKGYQIDRIDNNKEYCKSNCQWVTSKTNNRNKRNNHLEIFNGKTQCLSAWAEEFNINPDTLRYRVVKLNWSIEKALMTPVGKHKKKLQ